MRFTIFPFRRFPVQCTITYKAGPFHWSVSMTNSLKALSFGIMGTLLLACSTPYQPMDGGFDTKANTKVFPVLMPSTISNNINRIAILSLSDSFGTGVPAQLDYTVAVIRAQRPEIVFVERESLDKVTEELKLQHSGRVDDETSKRVGKMVGADTLLLCRILPFDKARASLVQADGGTISGGIEVHLIQVETGSSLFRQAVTAKTFFPPPNKGASWRQEGVMRAHGIASEEAAAYAFSALGASLGVNPLGIVPFVKPGMVMDILSASPAETAGLKKGDKIVSVNNRQFRSWTDRIDLPATMTVLREGKELQLSVSSR